MPKTKDQYRKVRRALAKIKKFRMKGEVADEYVKHVRRRVAKLALIVLVAVVAASSCACLASPDPLPLPAHKQHSGIKRNR